MSLLLYNTLTRKKEPFTPIDEKKVRLYACGPTVYNYAHIGNARPAVVFDLLVRLLRHHYGKDHVQYVRNITDIDDKIITAAQETGEPIETITQKFTDIYNEDMAALGVLPPDHQPRATEYIPQMIQMIEKIIKAGNAYEAEGHVLFHVPSFEGYGQLSRRNRDDMIAGARVEVAPYKKDPADFVLWKPSTKDQPGWDSPWGRGRPGWHLECSAMNAALNGEHFDIHAGGEDLIFPHHENEIAQSVCAHGGNPYVNVWMHNGYLMVEGQKMAKSVGNVLLIHDLIKKYPGEAMRLALLSAHYRQPFNWTESAVLQAKKTLDRAYSLLREHEEIEAAEQPVPEDFLDALKDDLNTPKALAVFSTLIKDLGAAEAKAEIAKAKGCLLAAGSIMGIAMLKPKSWFQTLPDGLKPVEIEDLIEKRNAARKAKDFAESDRIRDSLAEKGILIEDSPTGTTWRRKS